jgi:hypothetical protein
MHAPFLVVMTVVYPLYFDRSSVRPFIVRSSLPIHDETQTSLDLDSGLLLVEQEKMAPLLVLEFTLAVVKLESPDFDGKGAIQSDTI